MSEVYKTYGTGRIFFWQDGIAWQSLRENGQITLYSNKKINAEQYKRAREFASQCFEIMDSSLKASLRPVGGIRETRA